MALDGRCRRKLVVERAAYFVLVEQGVGFREAARRVGVDYRLTKRWRAVGRPSVPEPLVEREISSRLLSQAERVLIADLSREDVPVREIGRRLGRPASTISREVARNQQPDGAPRPHQAHVMAAVRRTRPKTGKIAADPGLRAVVQDGLEHRHGTAIGILVERSTRFVMLPHLPNGYSPAAVRDALVAKIHTLPTQLRRSVTWDQGSEMHFHGQFTHATAMPVYFCDPHSPRQRGPNENTNGLLRQYFPTGTDLSVHSAEHLDHVTAELNDRPRTTLDRDTPTERMTTPLAN